jgi:dTDP-4-dehydrorhamnose 3,5-epimerase-like enzyme
MTVVTQMHVLKTDEIQFSKENWIYETPIKGLLLFSPQFYPDTERAGGFQESYRVGKVNEILEEEIKPIAQSQISWSGAKVLRGMHAGPEDKYILPVIGEFYVAVVDVKRDSPTFGQGVTFTIDATDPGRKQQVGYFTRRGLAHGFYVVRTTPINVAGFSYSVTCEYNKDTSKGFNAFDPSLTIPWPDKSGILSPNDQNQPSFEEFTQNVDQSMYQ